MVERGDLITSPDSSDGLLWLPNTRHAIEQLEPESQRFLLGVEPSEFISLAYQLSKERSVSVMDKDKNRSGFLGDFTGLLWENLAYEFASANLGVDEVLTSPVGTARIYCASDVGGFIEGLGESDYDSWKRDYKKNPRPDGLGFVRFGDTLVLNKVVEYKTGGLKNSAGRRQRNYFTSGQVVDDLFQSGVGFIEELGEFLGKRYPNFPKRIYFDRRGFRVEYVRPRLKRTQNLEIQDAVSIFLPITRDEFYSVVDAFFKDLRSNSVLVPSLGH